MFINKSQQTPWTIQNSIGHTIDEYTNQIDHTVGFGAFDSICSSYSLGGRAIDIGGGGTDDNSNYCFKKYQTLLTVFDPFMREEIHNQAVLKEAAKNPFDSSLSISVLNVIDEKNARHEHIKLCQGVIKNNGNVFFKVWPGDGTDIPEYKDGYYQSNHSLTFYINEIQDVFGRNNVYVNDVDKIIIARKTS